MTKMIGYMYVSGLSDGRMTTKEKMAEWWWGRSGRTLEHAHVNWYDGRPLDEKVRQVENQVKQMLKTFDGVTIIGASAGGSLALNVFANLKQENVCVVTAHARLKAGDYGQQNWMSLHRRAKLDTDRPSRVFYDSVTKVETSIIPNLTPEDKKRILNLTQLTDRIVDLKLMRIDGVQTHRSVTFGHWGGYFAHLIADRDLIVQFAEWRLLDR